MFKVSKNIPPPDLRKQLKKGYCSLKAVIHLNICSMLQPFSCACEVLAQVSSIFSLRVQTSVYVHRNKKMLLSWNEISVPQVVFIHAENVVKAHEVIVCYLEVGHK